MKTRIITSVVALALLAAVLAFYHTIFFNIVAAAVCLLAVYEVCTAFKLGEKWGWIFAGFVPLVLFIFLAPAARVQELVISVCYLVCIYFAVCVVVTFPRLDFAKVGGAALFSVLAIGMFYSWIHLKNLFPAEEGNKALYLLLLGLCFAWGGDTMAYFTGMAFGRRKMAPALSPKKTIEGAIGGVCGGILLGEILTAIFFRFFIVPQGTTAVFYVVIAVLGLICTVLGIMGDLLASSVKRQMEIKDYGSIFPGHGGVLDRFDSVLLIAPFILFFITLLVRYFPHISML